MFGIGTDDRMYVIDVETAAATPVSSLAFTSPLNGTHFGLDFTPVADRLRSSSVESEQNLRFDPGTGTVVTPLDIPFAYAASDPHGTAAPAIEGSPSRRSD